MPLILLATDIQKILKYCRTNSYNTIKEIKEEYPASGKLIGSKVRIQDFADAFDYTIEEIEKALKEKL
jgi:ABC-type Fe3+-hydroxamate transport system substrate-binding protein